MRAAGFHVVRPWPRVVVRLQSNAPGVDDQGTTGKSYGTRNVGVPTKHDGCIDICQPCADSFWWCELNNIARDFFEQIFEIIVRRSMAE